MPVPFYYDVSNNGRLIIDYTTIFQACQCKMRGFRKNTLFTPKTLLIFEIIIENFEYQKKFLRFHTDLYNKTKLNEIYRKLAKKVTTIIPTSVCILHYKGLAEKSVGFSTRQITSWNKFFFCRSKIDCYFKMIRSLKHIIKIRYYHLPVLLKPALPGLFLCSKKANIFCTRIFLNFKTFLI